MPLGEIGALLLFLAAFFLFGNLWFHLMEALSRKIKKLFGRRKEPPPWHPLPSDSDKED